MKDFFTGNKMIITVVVGILIQAYRWLAGDVTAGSDNLSAIGLEDFLTSLVGGLSMIFAKMKLNRALPDQ